LCKIYVSLCQINKSVEVDYYKIRCNNDFRIIIPQKFSKAQLPPPHPLNTHPDRNPTSLTLNLAMKATSDYLEQITKRYTFSEREGFIQYDEMQLFDVREAQPEIDLYKASLTSQNLHLPSRHRDFLDP
jgi:hypothetical protein